MNLHSKPVGRVVLIPTFAYMINNPYRSIKFLYKNIFCLYELFIYANLCRVEGNPTYEVLKNQKHENLTYFSQKLFFNVKITLYKKWSKR